MITKLLVRPASGGVSAMAFATPASNSLRRSGALEFQSIEFRWTVVESFVQSGHWICRETFVLSNELCFVMFCLSQLVGSGRQQLQSRRNVTHGIIYAGGAVWRAAGKSAGRFDRVIIRWRGRPYVTIARGQHNRSAVWLRGGNKHVCDSRCRSGNQFTLWRHIANRQQR